MTEKNNNTRKRQMAKIVAVVIIVAAAITGWLSVRNTTLNPLSEDAELGASVVHIASQVPGKIVTLAVSENGKVHKGDLLFKLDPELYQLRVDQAQAELKIAEAAYDTQRRTMSAEQSNAAISDEQIARARANLQLTTQTLARLQPLLPKGYVTEQQVDAAATAKRDAEVSLKQALKQSSAAQALVVARRAALAMAERELANTEVRAPHDGRVVGLTVATGEVVLPNQSIFTLINTNDWYASAFFRETELKDIVIGRCADVYVMANSKKMISGTVEGIGWGVSSEDLLNIPRGLPYVPKSLNWVRVVQRYPVRIKLHNPPEELMRVGATAVVIVRHQDGC